jgi:hypothetical protein
MSIRHAAPLLALLVPVLAGCGDESSPMEPAPQQGCEMTLQVGQAADSGQGEGCRLRAAAGAEYALAVLDARAILSAISARERGFPSYDATVGLSAAAPPLAPRSSSASREEGAPYPLEILYSQVDELPEGHPARRADPWSLGEQFPLYDAARQTTVPARVVRVYPDGLVAAWVEGEAADQLEPFLDQLDYAVATVRQHAIPLLRNTFVPRLPVTSTGAGQYLMILRTDPSVRGRAYGVARGDSVLSWILLNVDVTAGPVSLASLLAHEMTHTYQMMYMRDTRPLGVASSSVGTSFWAVEGGANLISYEMIRRVAGAALDGNFDWRAAPGDPVRQFYALRAQPAFGEFTNGYDNSMGFLRDLVIRRVVAGEALDAAVREVSRGAVEGWYGFDAWGPGRAGLTARMRERLGSTWDPIDAMLDWTLSHAADDLTEHPVYQDRASLRVWDIPEGHPVGWRPAAVLSEGGQRAVTFSRPGGSPHYLYLRDAGEGVGFVISGTTPELRWRLIRTR